MKKFEHYNLFADLFRYPSDDYPLRALACMAMLVKSYPEAALEIKPFTEYITTRSVDEREELYTKTFDVQPICYLDLGYVIFGEDYKRGAFLLHMQEEQLKIANDCGSDLSDNISNMLTLFTKTENETLVNELAVKIMIPGVEKMIAEFNQARVELKVKILKKLHKAIIQEELNSGNVYRNAFAALLLVLKKDFAHISFDGILDPLIDVQHHNSFFSKNSVNNLLIPPVGEINELENNYKLN